ncbi:ABC-type multidrug transport system, ATPase component [Clostridium cavendishii DSM 21758]|uniref:ABC-type multidrug transport system, ATPase component n=1 Tax=Clostridium cavendishii DSM 21758 TaxID=1121302 RepID=A0A1M6M239_9CLOT|nr:ABC transporter ATP-binding protein [Clostridium cavendishii]SHJ77509.1 ABC-type multidrug transport system, ATPase component [Clostridium cavendishii DSM 21758]
MLEVNNLNKKYNKFFAAKDLNFTVNKGELAILVGPNGAGKSTTLKSIAGLLKYDGEIKVCGKNNKSIEGKKLLSYVPELPALFPLLSIDEHIHFIAKAYGISNYENYADELLEKFDLKDKRDKLGQELSKGMQQKVSICCALITKPKVILFDEPMIGLDPKAIKELKNILIELRDSGVSLLISTHLLDSMDGIWDRILIMKNGEIILSKNKFEFDNTEESLEDIFFEVTEDK